MGRPPTNLPAFLPTLIGREEAIESVRTRLLDEGGVLTLTGTGGRGKNRLARAVATTLLDSALFPDGVWLVELAPISDPLLIPSAVAASVRIKEQPGRSI